MGATVPMHRQQRLLHGIVDVASRQATAELAVQPFGKLVQQPAICAAMPVY